MSGAEEVPQKPGSVGGDDVPPPLPVTNAAAAAAAQTTTTTTTTKPPKVSSSTDPALLMSVSDDAKKFATSLQGEILTRLDQQSANLDKLFDAENLR